MKEKLKKLILLAMKAEYDNRAVDEILNILKELFDTNEVNLINNNDNFVRDQESIYVPIYVNDELNYFCEIKKSNNKFGIVIIDMLSSILSQMYTNIMVNYHNNSNEEIDLSTNVYNRNAFEKFKKQYFYTDYESVSCIFVDINGMNEINNEHGHLYGDKVIFNVATILKDTFKDARIFRVGGDEFVVIVANTDEQLVAEKANLAQEVLENNKIYISYGISSGHRILDIDFLINEADRLMFQDKSEFYQKMGKILRKKYHK